MIVNSYPTSISCILSKEKLFFPLFARKYMHSYNMIDKPTIKVTVMQIM